MLGANTRQHALVAGLALVALGASFGCKPNRADAGNRDANNDGVRDVRDTAAMVANNPDPDWNDTKIMRMVRTANTIDSAAGSIALTQVNSPAVKEYAQTMIRDHGSANKQARALMKKVNIADSVHLDDHDPALKMVHEAEEAQLDLREKAGADFDKAYLEREIDMHEDVLKMLDDDLIKHAQNAEVRSFLETIRPVVSSHMERAKALKEQLSNAKTD